MTSARPRGAGHRRDHRRLRRHHRGARRPERARAAVTPRSSPPSIVRGLALARVRRQPLAAISHRPAVSRHRGRLNRELSPRAIAIPGTVDCGRGSPWVPQRRRAESGPDAPRGARKEAPPCSPTRHALLERPSPAPLGGESREPRLVAGAGSLPWAYYAPVLFAVTGLIANALGFVIPLSSLGEAGYPDAYFLHDARGSTPRRVGCIGAPAKRPYNPSPTARCSTLVLSLPFRVSEASNPFLGPRLIVGASLRRACSSSCRRRARSHAIRASSGGAASWVVHPHRRALSRSSDPTSWVCSSACSRRGSCWRVALGGRTGRPRRGDRVRIQAHAGFGGAERPRLAALDSALPAPFELGRRGGDRPRRASASSCPSSRTCTPTCSPQGLPAALSRGRAARVRHGHGARHAAGPERPAPDPAAARPEADAPLLYGAITLLISSIAAINPGANTNYFLEFLMVAVPIASMALPEALPHAESRAGAADPPGGHDRRVLRPAGGRFERLRPLRWTSRRATPSGWASSPR